MPMVLVPLTRSETTQLLSDAPVEQVIRAADLPLIRLVAEGQNTAQVARALGISQRTVYRHVARLCDEFEVSTLQELSSELARRGF